MKILSFFAARTIKNTHFDRKRLSSIIKDKYFFSDELDNIKWPTKILVKISLDWHCPISF